MPMDHFLPSWLDRFFRNHPTVMALCVLALALVVSFLLISHPTRDIVLYEAF
jgi:hypothetical protein